LTGPSLSEERLTKVIPAGIIRNDKVDLPSARPLLKPAFALFDALMTFRVDEPVKVVALAESIGCT
jgi:hypothetical protein